MAKIKNKSTGTFETSYKKQNKNTEKMELRHIKSDDLILNPKKVISKLTIDKNLDTEFKFEKKWTLGRNKIVKLNCVEAEELYILLHDYYTNINNEYKYTRTK